MRFRVLTFLALGMAMSVNSYAYRISVWIAPWEEKSLTSIQLNGANISESNPVWYSLNADGSIVKNWNAEAPGWRAAMVGSEILPTIQNVVNGSFSASAVIGLLSSDASRETHAEAIAQLVTLNAFDGIDIDYERVPTSSRAQFTSFINLLAAKLHRAGKKLSVTVYAKISDSQNWDGPGSQDWSALGAIADSVKIMSYDFHWSTSEAGPLTPLAWLDKVAAYAESVIAPQKVMMGLPWYGYDWVGQKGTGVGYDDAMTLVRSTAATLTRDSDGEATFSYGGNHVVYFQDAASYARKVDLLVSRHASIGGFAHWRTGHEDPEIWKRVSLLKSGQTTAPPTGGTTQPPAGSGATPLNTDFAVTGTANLGGKAGSTVTSDYGIVAINGFASNVSVSVEKVTPFQGEVLLSSSLITPVTRTTLMASFDRATSSGSYQVRVRFSSGSVRHDQLVTIEVKPAVRQRAVR